MIIDDVVDGMARALFIDAWVEEQEEAGESFSGVEILDVAPPTSDDARDEALRFYGSVEQANRSEMEVLLAKAARADGYRDADEAPSESHGSYAWTFGWYLAMQGLGHGVGWFDDHREFPLKVPHLR